MADKTFQELGLSAPLVKQLEKLGYSNPTPIQSACIPLLLGGRDVMGLAQTGTGKTAAFALPLIQNLVAEDKPAGAKKVRALILSPTRELASQIQVNVAAYARPFPQIFSAVIYGGVGFANQVEALRRGVDILVATPGRLIDHMERGNVNLSEVETLVLDEADHMLDMGFAPALRRIVSAVPAKRRTQLFSATMPDTIAQLARAMLDDPETVAVTPPAKTADRVEQSICFFHDKADKKERLLAEIDAMDPEAKILIFTRMKHGANKVAEFLNKKRIPAGAIHGNKSQSARERALEEFKSGETPILVATDIAARGIDVKGIDLVINFDLPMEAESYVHRIGRTARAGKSGRAISFFCPDEAKQFNAIRKLLKCEIPLADGSAEIPERLYTWKKSLQKGEKPPLKTHRAASPKAFREEEKARVAARRAAEEEVAKKSPPARERFRMAVSAKSKKKRNR